MVAGAVWLFGFVVALTLWAAWVLRHSNVLPRLRVAADEPGDDTPVAVPAGEQLPAG